ncbi:MAG: chromosome segregation protein ScpA [Phycisphaerae bacterium]|nr:chromosome segregation protein ScpA [Phycisphaerae bacterium]
MVTQDDYRVRLEAFEGPLDLLLFLIRKHEVDIHNIPIASVADQYMDVLSRIDHLDIDQAGEFLLMAATLMELKSRILAGMRRPRGEGDARDDEDPRLELVKQLLEFKKYRDAARGLESRLEEWRARFPAAAHALADAGIERAADEAQDLDLGDLDVLDLVEAFARIMQAVDLTRLGDHQVVYDDTPIELHAADLRDRVRAEAGAGRPLTMTAVFAARPRGEMIGLFLAMLELVRRQGVRVRQDHAGGEILIEPGERLDDALAPGDGSPSNADPAPD